MRASADDFLDPSSIPLDAWTRVTRGLLPRLYDLDALRRRLLDPFAAGGPFRRRVYDVLADLPVLSADEDAPGDALLLLDGLFIHRDELHGRRDLSVLLDVPLAVAAGRLLRREGMPTRDRYVMGNRIYFELCDPRSRASLVVRW